MTDCEKLAELLKNCEELVIAIGCTYAEAADYLLAHGVIVQEEQKPMTVRPMRKPLMVEDLTGGISVFVEYNIGYTMSGERPAYVHAVNKEYVIIEKFKSNALIPLSVMLYGKFYRCWSCLPTDEERQAAKWEAWNHDIRRL